MLDTFVGGAAAQKSCVKNPAPELPWTPDTQFSVALFVRLPMITSNFRFGSFSYKRTSWFSVALLSLNNTVRHSILNIRLGALPDTEVKIPQFPPGKLAQPLRPKSVRWSCHTEKTVKSYGPTLGGAGRQFVM